MATMWEHTPAADRGTLQEFQESLARSPAVHEDGKDHYFGMLLDAMLRHILANPPFSSRPVAARDDPRVPTPDISSGQMSFVAAQGQ